MLALNFPTYQFRIKNSENSRQIFDIIRKKFVSLQPEEWVRQNTIRYLTANKQYPVSLIGVEKMILLNDLKKRADILVYNSDGSIKILVECKAPSVKITQATFDQIARYNLKIKAEYLMVTNGMEHFYCLMDYEKEKYTFLRQIPDFSR
ncbi:type I restriction enzyme HsdR N-terminal domain-containing protein [Eudoraea chungangensis]|uniref:type I restriction enzyme HsdR N-terminal domain-containing protein n=1 Tax=Eudoraea chungangensis TaxID=1481905 RepID=UPI0023EB981B|nr:type I restriction enzyme HsdR N-terminal domain-containing protein [Eudoraea chungangensis]